MADHPVNSKAQLQEMLDSGKITDDEYTGRMPFITRVAVFLSALIRVYAFFLVPLCLGLILTPAIVRPLRQGAVCLASSQASFFIPKSHRRKRLTVVPAPGLDSIWSAPLCERSMPRTTERPRPRPQNRVVK